MAAFGEAAVDAARTEYERVLGYYLCARARRQRQEQQLDDDFEEAETTFRYLEDQLMANNFVILIVLAEYYPSTHRERRRYVRSDTWFEDTLPNLSEFHFRQALRLSPSTFRYIVESCRPVLERQTTNMMTPISVQKRVAVGLYRLCSSAEDRTIAHLFGIGRSTVNVLHQEFCVAVVDLLEGEWLQMIHPNKMSAHMREFYAFTGFPQAIGALDGCHFPVSPPKEHATDYYNYKGWYSIILLAVVDHKYHFRYINVGSPGRCHDASVYGRSKLHTLIENGTFSSPMAMIEGTSVPPILLCDQAFPLSPNLQKPFPNAQPGSSEAVFNYNLSKTRRIVENGFGRLKARFRFVMKRMECRLNKAKLAIRAACVHHNICEAMKDSVEPQWESEARALDLYAQPSRNTGECSGGGQEVRHALANYFWKEAQHAP
ncbi:uncharacterized protein LOC144096777 [Amblyomma americanum]